MNERIKELYEQALEQYVSNNLAWEELNPQKFAELIVRECMTIATGNGSELTAQDIAQHFGVEE
jgi:hypothetical protein